MECRNCGELGISTELCKACVAAGVKIVKGGVIFKTNKPAAKKTS